MKAATRPTYVFHAAQELFMQTYGSLKYGSHGPTRMQWLKLGASLIEAGVKLPNDWAAVIKEEPK